ncbi:AlbA family DNA-binding domain-containing protein [Tunicatimonas pelagia]|uniref:AlbA family DNA-binding domain-containing protein n=1 Tax=Tunicatimonas pelagia TaxID=931531 RepID=UPI0026650267|nr:ATP-binding protein [Tunicatimonas pelagia]WKN41655.1 ATP-binding protein [Tunicatimonas pelagia]
MKKLKKLIHQGEGERLDFKQKITDPYKIAKTIASFANTKGGKILVGVRDDKTIMGVDPEEEKYTLETAAQFYCDPPITLQFKEVEDEEEDITVLEVTIPESWEKPHFVRDKNERRLVYIRQRDKSIPAGKTMVDLMRKGELPDNQVNLAHLDHNERKLLSFLERHERVTLKQFMQIVNISRRRALRILHHLTREGAIRMHEQEKEPYYTL